MLESLELGARRDAMPTSGLDREATAEAVSYEAVRAALPRLRMPYAPGASESFSGTALLPSNCRRQASRECARSLVSCADMATESISMPRKEILCTGQSCSSPG